MLSIQDIKHTERQKPYQAENSVWRSFSTFMACWTLWISDSWFSKGFWSEEIKIRVYWDQKKDTHLSATAQEVSRYSKTIWVLWIQMEDTLSLHKLFIWSYIFKFQNFWFFNGFSRNIENFKPLLIFAQIASWSLIFPVGLEIPFCHIQRQNQRFINLSSFDTYDSGF